MNTSPKIVATLGYQSSHGTSVDSAVILFALLSNAVRLKVLLRVINREWSVGELATDLKIGQSALSQHLTKLRRGGVVCSRRKRQTIYYSCNDAAVIGLLVEIGLTRPALRFDHGLPDVGGLRAGAS